MSFIRLENDDTTITAESIISPAWGENKEKLTTFFTSSFQSGSESGPYFLDVYFENQGALAPSGSVEFSIAHAVSGSSFTDVKNAVWNQYATLLYGSDRVTALSDLSSNFFIINVSRAKYKEKLNVSNLQIETSSRLFVPTDPTTFEVVDGGRKFGLKYGSTTGTGFVFPDVGVVVIKQSQLSGVTTLTNFFTQLKSSANFTLFSEETITSNFVFVRARNFQLNYSTNPSFANDKGVIQQARLVDSPQVFPTTVGLYNDANELVSVAKLSRPLIKDFNKEALLRIKLDF